MCVGFVGLGSAPASAAVENGKIAYALDGAIWTVNADGSDARKIADQGLNPVWSPDGTKIAYYRGVDGEAQVWVMNADGSGQRFLAAGFSPAWSPDSSK